MRTASRALVTAIIRTSVPPGRFPRPLRLLAAIGDIVLLFVPERPVGLRQLARDLAVLERGPGRRHHHLQVGGEAPLPGAAAVRARQDGESVIGAHEHRAVPTEAEADAAVSHRDPCRSRDDFERGVGMSARGYRHPQPAAVEAHAHRLGIETARRRGYEEHLGERGQPNGVAAHRPERGPHAGAGTHAVALGELIPQIGRVPLRIALLEPLRLPREGDHGGRQLLRLSGHRGRPREGRRQDHHHSPCAQDHEAVSSTTTAPSSSARASRRRP